MKAPEIGNELDARDLAQCIRHVLDRAEPWSDAFIDSIWGGAWDDDAVKEFNRLVAHDWEHVWNDRQCTRIMALHVANRLA